MNAQKQYLEGNAKKWEAELRRWKKSLNGKCPNCVGHGTTEIGPRNSCLVTVNCYVCNGTGREK